MLVSPKPYISQVCVDMRTKTKNLARVLCGLCADGGIIDVSSYGSFGVPLNSYLSQVQSGVGLGQGVHHRKDTETKFEGPSCDQYHCHDLLSNLNLFVATLLALAC